MEYYKNVIKNVVMVIHFTSVGVAKNGDPYRLDNLYRIRKHYDFVIFDEMTMFKYCFKLAFIRTACIYFTELHLNFYLT